LFGGSVMPLDGTFRGEEPRGPWCACCKEPITGGQRSVRVHFANDPHGFRGLTGEYHEACSKPFVSLAHVVNLKPFG
jgi:hypothetical protein